MVRVKTYAELSAISTNGVSLYQYGSSMGAEQLQKWKDEGLTVRQISESTGIRGDNLYAQYRYYGIEFNKPILISKWNLDKVRDPVDIDGQYVIGFLAADGYLANGRTVCTWIQERDVEILQRVISVLGRPDFHINRRERTAGQAQLGICIGSKEFMNYLICAYGFSNAKSRTIPFPRHLQNPNPYLRGYVDGNGYMGVNCTITTASDDFVCGLLDWVEYAYNIRPLVQRVGPNKNCFNVVFRKKHEQFLRDLFKYPGLTRKSIAFEKYLPNQRDRSEG